MGTIHGDTRQRMSKAAFSDLQKARQNNPHITNDGMEIELSRQGNRKYTNPRAQATNENFSIKQRLAPYVSEALNNSRLVDSAEDMSGHGVADAGFDYRETPVRYRGNEYTVTFDIAKSKDHNRNTLYEGNIRRKTPASPGELIEPGYNAGVYKDKISENPNDVNIKNRRLESGIKKAPRVSNDFSQNRLLEELNNSSVSQDPDNVKMKISDVKQIGKNSFSEQSLRKIIGEENDIITKTPDGNTRNAQGYADLRSGIVAVLDGKMSTANHEATHIAIYTLKQTNPKLADNAIGSIIRHYGAEELVNSANKAGYGDTVGHKLDFNNEADVRYAAEERLADDFAKYAEAKAKGRENYYAKKTGLPAQIKAWFDSVIDKLKDMAGRLDSAHNFMYKLERGDFAKVIDAEMRAKAGQDMDAPTARPQMAYKIDPETNIVHIENDILRGVPPKDRVKVISKYFKDNYQGNNYDLNYGEDGTARISAKSRNKYLDPNQSISELILKGKMTGELPDILKVSQKIGEAPDTKNHSFTTGGFEYRQSLVQIGENLYSVKINIGINDNGNLFYTINGIKKAPEFHKGNLSGGDVFNIAQDDNSVKMKLEVKQ